jgi:hypothetical protein
MVMDLRCANCEAMANSIIMAKQDERANSIASMVPPLNVVPLEALRCADHCAICTDVCAEFVRQLIHQRGEVAESDYQRMVQVFFYYGRFKLMLVSIPLWCGEPYGLGLFSLGVWTWRYAFVFA